MHIRIDRQEFLKTLARVHRVVDRRNTASILANILIEAKGDRAVLKATDMELEMVEEMPANCLQNGSITLPAYLLYDFIRRSSFELTLDIKVQQDAKQALISGSKIKSFLNCLPASNFPTLEDDKWDYEFNLDRAALRQLLNAVIVATSTEESRYTLSGVEMRIDEDHNGENKLKFAAVDGNRLAVGTIEIPQELQGKEIGRSIIPRKTIAELQKMIADEGAEQLLVQLSATRIGFKIGSLQLRSKLIDGRFPEYNKIIPQGYTNKLIVDRQEFMEQANCVSVMSSDAKRAMVMDLSPEHITLSMESLEANKTICEIAGEYEGEDLCIGYNIKYMLDEISQFSNDNLVIEFGNAEQPCIVKDGNNKDLIYVLMPMRY